MKKYILLLLTCSASVLHAQQSFTAENLTCEYGKNPLGIDNRFPRLSWNIHSDARNWRQSAYQIIVATDSASLSKDKGNLENEGKVISGNNIDIVYHGTPLRSFMNCWWKVRVWDANGKVSPWSKIAYWKMGVLAAADWKAQWIGSDLQLKDYQKGLRSISDFAMEPESEIWKRADSIRKYVHPGDSAPAVYVRKDFTLRKGIKRATAYVCGLGLHELYMNGRRVGDEYLNPAYTDYQKEVLYNTYDVTGYLKRGGNAIGVILGNGWYNLIMPHVLRFYAADYIGPPKLLLRLLVEYTDGSREAISSDSTWKYTTDGPIVYNDILSGENYDARKEMPGWCDHGYRDSGWRPCPSVEGPRGTLRSQQLYPVRELSESPAVRVENKDSVYRFDLGKELCGWVRIKIKGHRGQKIKISYEGAGSHTLGRYQTDYYILKGDGEETFEPRFSYNGFRFVDVEGLDYMPAAADVVGVLVATDLKKTGEFSCSNDTFNKIQQILLNTIHNYIVHIPNDPTREKSGWTQDIENGFDVNAYNFDVFGMYRKWQYDFNDIIFKNGYVPPVVPGRFAGPTINGPWWGGMIIYNVAKLDEYYHDDEIIKDSYGAMKSYLGYLTSIAKDNIVEWGLGDWMEAYGNVGGRPTTTPIPLTSTIAYYYYATTMARFAERLHKNPDARYFTQLAADIKESYNRRFFDAATGTYAQGSQASQLMSLHFGMVPEGKRDLVIRKLKEAIDEHNGHLSTGFVATPLLLTTLCDLGLSKEAYTMATKDDFPGWKDMIFNKGNSVMKENWEGGLVQMPSLAGPIGYWFYYSLAGIRPGLSQLLIKPDFIPDLSWVSASYQSIQGEIVSKWQRQGDRYTLQVTIPANTTATMYLPANADAISEGDRNIKLHTDLHIRETTERETVISIGSGEWSFNMTALPPSSNYPPPSNSPHE